MASSPSRRALLRAGTALLAALAAGPVAATFVPPGARLVHVDVYDRTSGVALPLYEKDGRSYIVGAPGHEYALRIRNLTGARILAVTSVDGVNVITGDTAAPSQSGYVIDPWGSVEIAGWRKNLARTAAFFFTEHANSYAARTGRPFDVGVIGVATFAERVVRPRYEIGEPHQPFRERSRADAAAEAAPPAAAAAPDAAGRSAEAQRDEPLAQRRHTPQPMAKLGTGHGRSETSHARQVSFERATSDPQQIVAIHYDRFENLAAMGVVHAPHHFARRSPRPFPGMRFVPDPY